MENQWIYINNDNNNNPAAARSRESHSPDLQLSLRPPVQNSSSSVAPYPPPPPPPPRRSPGRSHIQRANSITSHRISRNPGIIRRSSPAGGRCNSRSAAVQAIGMEASTREIRPPYLWSTTRRAVVHTLSHLKSNRIVTISGEVRCRRCQRVYEIEYDLVSKFEEIASFVEKNKDSFHDRAPSEWMNPNYPRCKFCGLENGARPVVPTEERRINWMFLLLGQMLGVLSLNHLKYFCGCTDNHRTGAKNRLLYLTYLTLCNQVDPSGRFSR